MDRIAQAGEKDALYRSIITAQRNEPEATSADAISAAARSISETLKLVGDRLLHGLGLDRDPHVARAAGCADHRADTQCGDRPAPRSGLGPALRPDRRRQGSQRHGRARLPHRADRRLCRSGQRIIITAGLPLGTPGATNMLRIAYVGSEG